MKVFGIEFGSPASLHATCRKNYEQVAQKYHEQGERLAESRHNTSMLEYSNASLQGVERSHDQTIRLLTDRITTLEEQNQTLLEQLQEQRESGAEREQKLMDRLLIVTAPNPASAAAIASLTHPVQPRPNLPRDRQAPMVFRGQPGQRQRMGHKTENLEPILTPEDTMRSSPGPEPEPEVSAPGASQADELQRALANADDVEEQRKRLERARNAVQSETTVDNILRNPRRDSVVE